MLFFVDVVYSDKLLTNTGWFKINGTIMYTARVRWCRLCNKSKL